MGALTGKVSSVEMWGPVYRGFTVSLPNGERGRLEDIRLRDGEVELLVATGLFTRRLVAIDGADVEAILPRTRRLIVEARSRRAPTEDGTGVDDAGGIIRMPGRHSRRLSEPPEEAA